MKRYIINDNRCSRIILICSRVRLFLAFCEAVFRDTTCGKLVPAVIRRTSIRRKSVATGQTEERHSTTIAIVYTLTAVKGKSNSLFTLFT